MLCVGHVLPSSIALEVAEQILASSSYLVAGVVVSRARNPSFIPHVVYKSLLAWAPSSCARVLYSRHPIDAVLIDLNALPIGTGAWDILFDV